ncbi:unnamed protein product [Nesidiocoris tenuis]|uniref:Uncharacterized protein n=1 Tax=Nesidiocoris tenuis TaxID=355587 RepID=A0A6H5H8X9_9HEMI|nr:unnamed protein product [Nesidiocoris tenuis]
MKNRYDVDKYEIKVFTMKSPLGQLTWICDGEGCQGDSKRTINHATGNGGQQKKARMEGNINMYIFFFFSFSDGLSLFSVSYSL